MDEVAIYYKTVRFKEDECHSQIVDILKSIGQFRGEDDAEAEEMFTEAILDRSLQGDSGKSKPDCRLLVVCFIGASETKGIGAKIKKTLKLRF